MKSSAISRARYMILYESALSLSLSPYFAFYMFVRYV